MGIIANFTEWILPRKCLVCSIETEKNASFCSTCFKKVTFIDYPICNICGKPMEVAGYDDCQTCNTCSGYPRFFESARSLLLYDRTAKNIIMKIKNQSDSHAISICVRLLHSKYKELFKDADMVVPVPSHWTRILRRGYNPATSIALELSKIAGIQFKSILKKRRKTAYQRDKSTVERILNVKGAFDCKKDLTGKTVVLVDDVLTTGATLNECARTLKDANAKKIICITIASTSAVMNG